MKIKRFRPISMDFQNWTVINPNNFFLISVLVHDGQRTLLLSKSWSAIKVLLI